MRRIVRCIYKRCKYAHYLLRGQLYDNQPRSRGHVSYAHARLMPISSRGLQLGPAAGELLIPIRHFVWPCRHYLFHFGCMQAMFSVNKHCFLLPLFPTEIQIAKRRHGLVCNEIGDQLREETHDDLRPHHHAPDDNRQPRSDHGRWIPGRARREPPDELQPNKGCEYY